MTIPGVLQQATHTIFHKGPSHLSLDTPWNHIGPNCSQNGCKMSHRKLAPRAVQKPGFVRWVFMGFRWLFMGIRWVVYGFFENQVIPIYGFCLGLIWVFMGFIWVFMGFIWVSYGFLTISHFFFGIVSISNLLWAIFAKFSHPVQLKKLKLPVANSLAPTVPHVACIHANGREALSPSHPGDTCKQSQGLLKQTSLLRLQASTSRSLGLSVMVMESWVP